MVQTVISTFLDQFIKPVCLRTEMQTACFPELDFNYGRHYSGEQAVHLSLTTLAGAWPVSAGTHDPWTDSYSWPNS